MKWKKIWNRLIAKREDLQKQVKVLERQIDDMVYKLYELSNEEIELIEESLK